MKHIKIILIVSIFLSSGISIYGQAPAQAREGSVIIDKQNRNAVMISIDQPKNITEDALEQRFQRSGLKDRTRNGVAKYKEVVLSEISQEKLDIYTKVENGPNNSSIVYMTVSSGYDNFNRSLDTNMTKNIKTFLESFVIDASLHSADIGISNLINEVNKEEKAYQRLSDEQTDLEKKQLTIANRLSEIEKERNTKKEVIDKKKTEVESAKTKRGTVRTY
jgi:hypothetical protein